MRPMRGRTRGTETTDREARRDWWGMTIDAPDPPALARFYGELLGWEVTLHDDGGAAISPGDGVATSASSS